MRILIISSEFPPGPGGIGQHAYSLANALASENQVDVLCNQDYVSTNEIEAFNKNTNNISIEIFKERTKPFYLLKRVFQTIRKVYKNDFDMIIATGRLSLLMGGVIKLIWRNQKVSGFTHGSEVTLNSGKVVRLTYMCCRLLDQVIAVSEFTKSQLILGGVKKVSVIPNGLDNQFLFESKSIQKKYSWNGNPKLLTVGNTTLRKGQHRVIKALPLLHGQFSGLHYHIVGLPTGKEYLLGLAKENEVEDLVTFHGRIPEKSELMKAYNSVDVFVMLSENQKNGDVEGFGIAILEANAFGIPAIGAKGCGIDDAINNYKSGILVDGNNHRQILEALNEISSNINYYKYEARKWAEKHNWESLSRKILNT